MTGKAGRKHCRITRVTSYVVGMRWRNCVFAHVETTTASRASARARSNTSRRPWPPAIDQLAHRYVTASRPSRSNACSTTCCATSSCAPDHQQRHRRDRDGDVGHRRKGAGPTVYDLLGGRMHERCRPTPTPGTARRRRRANGRRRRPPSPPRATAASSSIRSAIAAAIPRRPRCAARSSSSRPCARALGPTSTC